LLEADTIAQKSVDIWFDKPNQAYYFPQVENLLRWYALADNIQNEGMKE